MCVWPRRVSPRQTENIVEIQIKLEALDRVLETNWHQLEHPTSRHRAQEGRGGATPGRGTSSLRGPSRSLACSASPRSSVPAPLCIRTSLGGFLHSTVGGRSLRAH
jgi:hypothetical protein